MAGNKHQRKSIFSRFIKVLKGRADDYPSYGDDAWGTKKVYPSEEDNTLRVVAEPGIDKKASAYILNFHQTRSVSEAWDLKEAQATHHHQSAQI